MKNLNLIVYLDILCRKIEDGVYSIAAGHESIHIDKGAECDVKEVREQ